jgi:predicted NACHT family NTPase
LQANETSNRIPIFIELRRLRQDVTLETLILSTLAKYKIPNSPENCAYLAGTGKFALLLDAFDEVEPSISGRTVADIESLADLYQEKLQIIITSRPDADIQRSSRFRVLKLAPLDSFDHLPFLQKICTDQDQAHSLAKVVSSSATDIKALLKTPLMMTLLVILYTSLQTIPDTLPKFYEELFEVLFYRHDQSKPGFRRKRYTELDDSKVKKLFAALCFVVRLESLGTLTGDKLRECVAKAAVASNEKVDPDKFRDELTKTVCLMLQDGLEYSFIHKSVTQYYAASFIRNSTEAFSEKFYTLISKEPEGGRWDLEHLITHKSWFR